MERGPRRSTLWGYGFLRCLLADNTRRTLASATEGALSPESRMFPMWLIAIVQVDAPEMRDPLLTVTLALGVPIVRSAEVPGRWRLPSQFTISGIFRSPGRQRPFALLGRVAMGY